MLLRDLTVSKVESAFTVHLRGGNQNEIRHRKSYGVTFALSGKIIYAIDGREFVSDQNSILFLPKGRSYRLYCQEGGLFPVINFDAWGRPDIDTIRVMPVRSLEYYQKAYEKMERLLLYSMRGPALHVLSLFYDMLARMNDEQAARGLSGKLASLDRAVRYLEQHSNLPGLRIETLAAQVDISAVYFRKLFARQYGLSPKQYLQKLRMEKARELLESDLFSVTDIAEKTGFGSVYHFCRSFKDYNGCTPLEYQKQASLPAAGGSV